MSRVNRFAISSDLEMQSRRLSRPFTHRRNALALLYCLSFFDQQRRVVPVGTEVSVVVLDDNKLTVADESTAGVNDPASGRRIDGLAAAALDEDAGVRTRVIAKI